MARKHNTVGGGSQTNANGLQFERDTNLLQAISATEEYTVNNNIVFDRDDNEVAYYYEKHRLYTDCLVPRGVNYKDVISRKLLPDGALLVGNTIYIIEKKYQNGDGSVDEKLQTCDFKKKQYIKLFGPLSINVEYYYLLNSWFNQDRFRDVFDYIESVGCKYFMEEMPLSEIGL